MRGAGPAAAAEVASLARGIAGRVCRGTAMSLLVLRWEFGGDGVLGAGCCQFLSRLNRGYLVLDSRCIDRPILARG